MISPPMPPSILVLLTQGRLLYPKWKCSINEKGKGALLGNYIRSTSWDYILLSSGAFLIDFRLKGSSWLLQLMCTIKAWEQALFLWKRMQMYAKLLPKGFKFRFTVFLLTKDPAHCDQGHPSKNQNQFIRKYDFTEIRQHIWKISKSLGKRVSS